MGSQMQVFTHVEKREVFTWEGLDPLDKKILDCARKYGWVSQQKISEWTNKSRRTIIRRIRALEGKGFLRWTHAKSRRSTVTKRHSQLRQNVTVPHRDIPDLTSKEYAMRPQFSDDLDGTADAPRSRPTPKMHRKPGSNAALDAYRASFSALYGVQSTEMGIRAMSVANDAVARLGGQQRWVEVLAAYFNDHAKWLMTNKHPLGLLVKQLDKYSVPTPERGGYRKNEVV